jgi:hypothetical protein
VLALNQSSVYNDDMRNGNNASKGNGKCQTEAKENDAKETALEQNGTHYAVRSDSTAASACKEKRNENVARNTRASSIHRSPTVQKLRSSGSILRNKKIGKAIVSGYGRCFM